MIWALDGSEFLKNDGENILKEKIVRSPFTVLNIIEEDRTSRLGGKTGQYRELKRKTICAVRRDKEAQVRGVC